MRWTRSLSLLVVASFVLAGVAGAVELAGVTVPDRVEVAGQSLKLQGAGIRKKFIFKVYVGALYLATPTSDPAAAVGADEPKRITMVFVRSVGEKKLRGAFEDGFFKAAQERLDALKPRIDRFLSFFAGGVEKGDEITLTYVPGKGTVVAVRGQEKGVIEGKDFMEALWGIWLGEAPADSGLKKAMLGRE